METIIGTVSCLDRNTTVSSTGDNTSTTHTATFKLDEERVILHTKSPAMFEDGDQVKVAGMRSPGQFLARHARNMTTGWRTPLHTQGCAIVALGFISLVMGAMAIKFILIAPLPLILLYFIVRIIRHDAIQKKAYRALN